MRDFRDAKAMAHALRDALQMRAVEITHSEGLELIAKAFGYETWNILSAKIEAVQSREADKRTPSGAHDPEAKTTLYCSFCGKSQHDVRALIAGPTVFICDECVSLCDDIIDHKDDQEILNLLKADVESGNQAYPAAFEHLSHLSTEDVASYVGRCRKAAERHRLGLQYIQRSLSARRSNALEATDLLASPRFAKLKSETEEELRTRLDDAERGLKRYEDAIHIGVTVLGARGRQTEN